MLKTNLIYNYILNSLVIFFIIFVYAVFIIYIERKIAAYMQCRIGPKEVGYHGLTQSFADLLKLFQKKENSFFTKKNPLFFLGPLIMVISVISAFFALPLLNLNAMPLAFIGIIYILVTMGVHCICIFMSGMASNSTYASLASMRIIIQTLSYKIALVLCCLCVIICCGEDDLYKIGIDENLNLIKDSTFIINGGFFNWNLCKYPTLILVYLIYFITSLSAAHRAPFDLPEAGSELVSGYYTEYSGIFVAWIMLTEYCIMLILSIIGVILFLGGGSSILPNIGMLKLFDWTTASNFPLLSKMWIVIWMTLKVLLVVFMKIAIRWSVPRIRFDQVIVLYWKFLTPISMALFLLLSLRSCE